MKSGAKYAVTATIAVVLSAATLHSIRVPGTIVAPGRVSAHREWRLMRGSDGRIAAMLTNNATGTVEELAVATFERGDRTEMSLSPRIRRGASVSLGDTIGTFRSERAREQWFELQGQVLEEQTALGMYSAGEKEAEIAIAGYRLEQAEERAALKRRQAERYSGLIERGMAAQSEYDAAQSELRVAESRRERAIAELEAARTGAGEQVIEWRRAQLRTAERQLLSASERLADSVLVAPFEGRVVGVRETDVLVALRSLDSCVVTFLVPWPRRSEIVRGQDLIVAAYDLRNEAPGRVVHVGSTVLALNGRQYAEVAALALDGDDLAPGLVVDCVVETGKITALQFVLSTLFQ